MCVAVVILGVEILSDDIGISIDDAVVQSQTPFICRTILPWDMQPQADWIYDLGAEMGLEIGEVEYENGY